MKWLSPVFLILWLMPPTILGGIEQGPDFTLLANQAEQITIIGEYAIGLSDAGLIILEFDEDSNVYEPVSDLLMGVEPVDVKLFGSVLAVRLISDDLAFYDISSLPQLKRLGEAGLPVYYDDFVLNGNDLYLSRWFDGIWRYHLDDFENPEFIDSSLKPILATQLDLSNDTLYVLDQYNGIARYDISGDSFGTFIDYLYIPRMGSWFNRVDSTFLIGVNEPLLYIGKFDQANPRIVDSIIDVGYPDNAFLTDSFFVILSQRDMSLVSRTDYSSRQAIDVLGHFVDGNLVEVDNRMAVLLSRMAGGITFFNLSDTALPIPAMNRPGPVTDLKFSAGRLFTAGELNPVDAYSFELGEPPEPEYTIYSAQRNVGAMEVNGDTLFALYANLGRIAVIIGSNNPDSFFIERSFSVDTSEVSRIELIDKKYDTLTPLIVVKDHEIDVYTISDSSEIHLAASWRVAAHITSVLWHDTALFIGTSKNTLEFYTIDSSFQIEYQSSLLLDAAAEDLIVVDGRLLAFVYDVVYQIDISNVAFPQVLETPVLPLPVLDVHALDSLLYTIGPQGVGLYKFVDGLPQLLEQGGRPGTFLAVDGKTLATSDGGSVNVYLLTSPDPVVEPPILPTGFAVSQNYPNPFNGTTRIQFSIDQSTSVELAVFNSLGQRVALLVNGFRESDITHDVFWDGTNSSGQSVASGVYFYRLIAAGNSTSKKMIYLK